ncbi:DUF3037 domain-containing protein [Oceanimonas smirnovii]|uniref:DUF3037 domain-containing protein n=1 Tax=Oceanimonas smirnovii TaxID=264574 RepID=UPI003FD3BDE5
MKFTPCIDTGEFAALGIVLCCPALGYFGHRTNTSQFERIDRFFAHLNPALVRQAASYMAAELDRVEALARSLDQIALKNLFQETVKPREGMARFTEVRPIMLSALPQQELDTLYQRLVDHRP